MVVPLGHLALRAIQVKRMHLDALRSLDRHLPGRRAITAQNKQDWEVLS